MSDAPKKKRLAIVIDLLVHYGGAEQVAGYMMEGFPEADIYTPCFDLAHTLPEYAKYRIHTHWATRFIKTHEAFKLFFPYIAWVMRHWRIGDYDVILSSAATVAKYLPRQGAEHVCYCYTPTRAIWQNDVYFGEKPSLARRVFHALLPYFKRQDIAAAGRVDRFIAISDHTKKAIRAIYHRDSEVLFSPIQVEKFQEGLKEEKQDFFLLISRLEKWKRVDYAVEAFNRLGLPLVIVGEGNEREPLEAMARDNIRFLGRVSLEEIVRLYGQARCVIFTPYLEYGLVPIEAVAAGTPVMSLDCPGVRETMSAGNTGADRIVVFFPEQTADSLVGAVREFEGLAFDRQKLSAYADQFSVRIFQQKLREIVYRNQN